MAIVPVDRMMQLVLGNFDRGHFDDREWQIWPANRDEAWENENAQRNTFKCYRQRGITRELFIALTVGNQGRNLRGSSDLAIKILTFCGEDARTYYQIARLIPRGIKIHNPHEFLIEKLETERTLINHAGLIRGHMVYRMQPRLDVVERFHSNTLPSAYCLEQLEELMFDEVWAIANDEQKWNLIELATEINPNQMEMGTYDLYAFRAKEYLRKALQDPCVHYALYIGSVLLGYFAGMYFPDACGTIILSQILVGVVSLLVTMCGIEGYEEIIDKACYIALVVGSIFAVYFIPLLSLYILYRIVISAAPEIKIKLDREQAAQLRIYGPKAKEVWQEMIKQERG